MRDFIRSVSNITKLSTELQIKINLSNNLTNVTIVLR